MLKWFVSMLFFVALVADAYIYRNFIRTRFSRRSWRAAYLVFAIVTDCAALTALALYGAAADRGSAGVVVVMWLVWLFFVAVVPKLLYLAGGIVDGAVGAVIGRRCPVFRWIGVAASLVVVAAMICGATLGRTRTRIEQVEICSNRIPPAFDGYRIVQLGDLHIGTMMRPERQTARLVDRVAQQRGDMVVNMGDVINLTHDELTPRLVSLLGGIEAPDGVWSVWGNHDLGFYIKEDRGLTPEDNLAALAEKLRAAGWRVLSDRSTWISRPRVDGTGVDSILLSGLDYPHDPMLSGHNASLAGADISGAFRGVEGEPFSVVLSHTPRLWEQITAHSFGDLTLSGHVHSMQTKLKFGGGRWSPAQYMYPQWSGKYTAAEGTKNSVLYVNDGVGCVGYPMRIGTRGEITVITLKRCE